MAVSRNLRQFAVRMDFRADEVEVAAADFSRRVASLVAREVITDTPVDTGQARANFLGSIGTPRSGTRSTLGKSPNAAIAEAVAIFQAFERDGRMFLTNNLDYIADLDRGKSSQAAAGYVRAALLRGVDAAIAQGFRLEK